MNPHIPEFSEDLVSPVNFVIIFLKINTWLMKNQKKIRRWMVQCRTYFFLRSLRLLRWPFNLQPSRHSTTTGPQLLTPRASPFPRHIVTKIQAKKKVIQAWHCVVTKLHSALLPIGNLRQNNYYIFRKIYKHTKVTLLQMGVIIFSNIFLKTVWWKIGLF